VSDTAWLSTAALVVEILSTGDETWDKLGFYASHGVDEVLVVDGERRRLQWFALRGERYDEVSSSALLGVPVVDVAAGIAWP
jgi:Uma2 family endonuclease